jgi:hypothetical protein
MKPSTTNFWEVHWGADDAKGDTNLRNYFLKIPEYDDLKCGKYRYIIGRKGTGKTAIIEQIQNDSSSEYNCFCKYLSLKNFPVQTLRELKDRSQSHKSQFVPIWTFLIVTELCKLILQDNGVQSSEAIIELRKFIDTNFPSDLGFTGTLRILESQQNKVNISTKLIDLGKSNHSTIESDVPVHYQKATEIIINLLKSFETESKFYLLFDELDEGYSVQDKSLNLLLLALLRAVENTFLDLKHNINFYPVVALRSDIFDNLQDNDLNKLDDYIINLKWTKELNKPYSIKELINARINASITVPKLSYAWERVTTDIGIPSNINTLWDFMYNQTFERPRDFIKYVKCCKKLNKRGTLDFKSVKEAEKTYSEWFFKEFRDEIQSHLPIWQEASQAIIKLNQPTFTFDEIKIHLDKDPNIQNYLKSNNRTPENIVEMLFNFSLIGTYGDNRHLFKYKDHNLPFSCDQKLILHYGFTRKFNIKTK